MSNKRVLITGITGQDGSYLADLLLAKGYQVFGLTRDVSPKFSSNIAHMKGQVELHYCPYTEYGIIETVKSLRPQEIYNLGGQTYVGKSWDIIPETVQTAGVMPVYFLEAILKTDRSIKFFQASSAEIFRPTAGGILTEESPIEPSNPYGCSKAFSHHMVAVFRKHHGLHAVNGILFNHESPRRAEDFLSKKVVRAAVAIKLGVENKLFLGNLSAARDWGYAPDYVDAMHRMMQVPEPRDLIISTGQAHTVEEVVSAVFDELGLDWREFVKSDPKLVRPMETPIIYGSNEKIHASTGWKPATSFREMLRIMVAEELSRQQKVMGPK